MEAIVAVAILGVASVPLLMLQSQNARSVMRLEASAARIAAESVAADYLLLLDLTSSTEGQVSIGGGWIVNWQASPVSDGKSAVIGVGMEGRYAAQLVRIDAIARHEDGREFSSEVFRSITIESLPYRAF
jgi:hypothetical protein